MKLLEKGDGRNNGHHKSCGEAFVHCEAIDWADQIWWTPVKNMHGQRTQSCLLSLQTPDLPQQVTSLGRHLIRFHVYAPTFTVQLYCVCTKDESMYTLLTACIKKCKHQSLRPVFSRAKASVDYSRDIRVAKRHNTFLIMRSQGLNGKA